MPFLERAEKDGKISYVDEVRGRRIIYLASGGHSERITDPEEQVRGSPRFFLALTGPPNLQSNQGLKPLMSTSLCFDLSESKGR